jgi:hypothetical protein
MAHKEVNTMGPVRIPPAGDPFQAAGDQDHSHCCNASLVKMEVEVIDPDTDEETFEEALYLCRKCAERS